jgi:hypothetical protein
VKKYVISIGLIMLCVGCGIGAYFFFQKGNEKCMEEKRQSKMEQQIAMKQETKSELLSEEKTETTDTQKNSSETEPEQPVIATGNMQEMNVPKTGDVGILMAYSLLAGSSLAVMGAVLIWKGQKS